MGQPWLWQVGTLLGWYASKQTTKPYSLSLWIYVLTWWSCHPTYCLSVGGAMASMQTFDLKITQSLVKNTYSHWSLGRSMRVSFLRVKTFDLKITYKALKGYLPTIPVTWSIGIYKNICESFTWHLNSARSGWTWVWSWVLPGLYLVLIL